MAANVLREFDTWDDFVNSVADRKANNRWTGKYRASNKTGRAEWTGCENFAEAVNLARYGWPRGRERMGEVVAALAPERGVYIAKGYDVAGAFPDVQRAIGGDPAAMITPKRSQIAARPVVRIDYNYWVHSGISAQCILNRGAAVLSLCDQLENQGYSVELRIVGTATSGDDSFKVAVTYKRAGQALDLDRAAFAITHPAVLRYLTFALVEQHSEIEDTFQFGYGTPQQEPFDDGALFIPGASNADYSPEASREAVAKLVTDYLA